MIKAELRKACLERQKAVTAEFRNNASRAIADRFFASFTLVQVRTLHCFIPIEKFNEVDTRLMIERLWWGHPQIRVVVPRVDPDANEIRSLVFSPETELVRSEWGIEEPVHDDFIESSEIDLVLVPGLCFDRQGHRIGYGKGYYDRFLQRCRADCGKIGLSLFEPVEKIDDVYEGDVPLDAVVTPDEVFQFRQAARLRES